MSEYQYYEFQAIDRPLTSEEQAKVRNLSSRAVPTPTKVSFVYHYTGFPDDPERILLQYYDTMLYMTNWGTRELMFRFPKKLLNAQDLTPYLFKDTVYITGNSTYSVLHVELNELESGDWVEGEGWLDQMIAIRQDLLHGDYRLLYLVWLKTAELEHQWAGRERAGVWDDEDDDWDDEDEEAEDDDKPLSQEPPVPSGLQQLSAPYRTFLEFIDLSEDLVAAAAQQSQTSKQKLAGNLENQISLLPESEKNSFLIRLLRGEKHLDLELAHRLQALTSTEPIAVAQSSRTIAELIEAAKTVERQRHLREQEIAAKKREQYLEKIAKHEEFYWQELPGYIERKNASGYERAIETLVDLRDLAQMQHQEAAFQERLQKLKAEYTYPGFHKRLERVGL